jgi:hypothetical protein
MKDCAQVIIEILGSLIFKLVQPDEDVVRTRACASGFRRRDGGIRKEGVGGGQWVIAIPWKSEAISNSGATSYRLSDGDPGGSLKADPGSPLLIRILNVGVEGGGLGTAPTNDVTVSGGVGLGSFE